MTDPLAAFVQILQVLSAPLTLIIAVLTLKGKSDNKNAILVGMQKDIEQIKKDTSGLSDQRSTVERHTYEIDDLKKKVESLECYHKPKGE